MDFESRIRKVQERFDGFDTLLITNMTNVRYLSGFRGSTAILLVSSSDALLVTDGRYNGVVQMEVAEAGAPVEVAIANVAKQRELISARAGSVVGLEGGDVSWDTLCRFREWFGDAELKRTSGVVEEVRRVKDPGEIARLKEAARIMDEALAKLRPKLDDRPTEKDFAFGLEEEVRALGAEGLGYDPTVASGAHSGSAHWEATDSFVEPHTPLLLDCGALFHGYHSDMTRMVGIGELDAQSKEMYELIRESQVAGVAAVRAGVAASEVDAACRKVIEEKARPGWAETFTHAAGHGVGLEIHEAPRVAGTAADILTEGEAITVEPGVYLAGIGGARIEDTVIVTADGCEIITHTTKDLYA